MYIGINKAHQGPLTTRFEYISYARQRYVLDYFSSEAMFTLDQVLHLLYIRSVF